MRPGLSSEDVATAAERLRHEGRQVSTVAVREKLGGKGSYTTIQRYLEAWRENQAAGKNAEPTKVPASVTEALTRAGAEVWSRARDWAAREAAGEKDRWANEIASRDRELREASDEMARLEGELETQRATHMELMEDADGARREVHDENLIIKAELKAALGLAQELRAVAEDAERRSRLASERAEALAATLTEVRCQLQLSNNRITRAEAATTEAVNAQLQAERRAGELDARLVGTSHELTQARQNETTLRINVIDLEQKLTTRDGDVDRLNSEILDARGLIDVLRSGETELKEALAGYQVVERELRQRLATEMERVARCEERLSQMTAAMGRWASKSTAERELE